jgi:ribonuclease D
MTPPPAPSPTLVETPDELQRIAAKLHACPRIAFDLESNGMHAYRATACVVQLASDTEVFLVDAKKTSLLPLAPLLASNEVIKVVHDVSFDARILAEEGLVLANVEDTAVAARMLARPATGLLALLERELGVHINKGLQQHDWARRPLTTVMQTYLAGDVVHLEALADRLFGEVKTLGILAEVEEETKYRLSQAIEAASTAEPRPPYVRIKGIERAPRAALPLLRHLANVREALARELDVPPYKVLSADVLFAIAHAKPSSQEELAKIRGATGGARARSIAQDLLDAVAAGLEDGSIPDEDAHWFERPSIAGDVLRARRGREQRLIRWRKDEAKRRTVDEQVVLPGHCLQALANLDGSALDAIAAVPGIGAFRTQNHGETWASLLRAPTETGATE